MHAASSPGFVAMSKFVIANGMTAEVKAAFRDRPHHVEEAGGFYRDSHAGIPKGLKLVPSETGIRHFEHVSS